MIPAGPIAVVYIKRRPWVFTSPAPKPSPGASS